MINRGDKQSPSNGPWLPGQTDLPDSLLPKVGQRKVHERLQLGWFLSQVIPYQGSDLERLYTFLRLLSPKCPSGPLASDTALTTLSEW